MPQRYPARRKYLYSRQLAAALLTVIFAAGICQALPDDRSQPIHISADKALRDEKKGVTVYSGNVQMNQGSMYIEADTLTIYHIEAEADKIVAEGTPARMRQRPDMEKGPVHARALVIEYYQREEKVHLRTQARVEQDGAIVAGDSIDYFIAEELVKADSNGAEEGNRVQVVIPPNTSQEVSVAPKDAALATAASAATETETDTDTSVDATTTEQEEDTSVAPQSQ